MITSIWGSWPLFQELLQTCRGIGDRHDGASIASIATRWVLDHDYVAAVLIGECPLQFCLLSSTLCLDLNVGLAGTRMGVSNHIDDTRKIFQLRLTEQDKSEIETVLARSNREEMITRIGDCGAEYRRRVEGVKYFSPKGHA